MVLDLINREQNGLILGDDALLLKGSGDLSGALGNADDQRIFALLALK